MAEQKQNLELPRIKVFNNISMERMPRYLAWSGKQMDRLWIEMNSMSTARHPVRIKLTIMRRIIQYLESENVFNRQFAPNLDRFLQHVKDVQLRQQMERDKPEITKLLDAQNSMKISELDYLTDVFEKLSHADTPEDIERVRAEAEKMLSDEFRDKTLAESLSRFSEVNLVKESEFVRRLDEEIRGRAIEPKKLGEAVEILEREFKDDKLAHEISKHKEDFPHSHQIENLRQRHNEISPDGSNFINFIRPYIGNSALVQRDFMDFKVQRFIDEMSSKVIAFGYLNMISASINREIAQKDWPVFKRFIDDHINFEALVRRFKDGHTLSQDELVQGYNGLAGKFMRDSEIAGKLEEFKKRHSTISEWAMGLSQFIRESQVRLARETIAFIQRRILEMDRAVESIDKALEKRLIQLKRQEKNVKQLLLSRIDLKMHQIRTKVNDIRKNWLAIAKLNYESFRYTANKMRDFLRRSLNDYYALVESYAIDSISSFRGGKQGKVISKIEMDIVNYVYNLAVEYWFWYNRDVLGRGNESAV